MAAETEFSLGNARREPSARAAKTRLLEPETTRTDKEITRCNSMHVIIVYSC